MPVLGGHYLVRLVGEGAGFPLDVCGLVSHLQTADATLDGVSLLAGLTVEGRWPAAMAATSQPFRAAPARTADELEAHPAYEERGLLPALAGIPFPPPGR